MKSANAWVSIPPGDYRIGDARRAFILHKTVWMTRYPVTNAQYGRFIEQGGYAPDRPWWSDEGREWLVGERVREPRFWRSARWNAPNQPVVGVSFWEAEAFANWAGGRLPRESEWEAAACGEQGLAYPWGDQWEPMICNVREADEHDVAGGPLPSFTIQAAWPRRHGRQRLGMVPGHRGIRRGRPRASACCGDAPGTMKRGPRGLRTAAGCCRTGGSTISASGSSWITRRRRQRRITRIADRACQLGLSLPRTRHAC